MTEPKPSAWLYEGGEDEDFASGKRWPAGVIRAQGWTETPLFTREAIEAEIVAWLREIAAWNNKHDDGLSGLDKMAQGQLEAAEAIELGEYRSKSDEGRPVST